MTVLLPGDKVAIGGSSSIKLGPGFLPSPGEASSSSLTAIRAGALGHIESSSSSSSAAKLRSNNDSEVFWVETNTQRYIPSPGDSVVCQITNRGAESYTVSLFSAHSATLPALSFEGATKRHKPNLKIGALVYAKVVSADRFTEPELTCVNPVTGKSDGYGDLKTTDERGEQKGTAMIFHVSLGLARSLLRPTHTLLKHISSHFPFEAAIGQNGVLWIRANEAKHVIAVGKVLEAADQAPTSHASFSTKPNHGDSDADMQEDEDEDTTTATVTERDADWILKNRAKRLDVKSVRKVLQESL